MNHIQNFLYYCSLIVKIGVEEIKRRVNNHNDDIHK